jgi:hypothetical protein
MRFLRHARLFLREGLIAELNVMTHMPVTTSTADALVMGPKGLSKELISIQEIAETFEVVKEDIKQIGKLLSVEKVIVANFFESLKQMAPLVSSISVTTSVLPFHLRGAFQAYLDLRGHLTLTFESDRREVWDLGKSENLDLLIVVVEDIIPKLRSLIGPNTQEVKKPKEAQTIAEIPIPQAPAPPELIFTTPAEITANLPEPAPIEEMEELPQEVTVPIGLEEKLEKIEAITSETLNYLELLGGEVFEESPVSKYFDDWIVNVRQIILSFESSDVIASDEIFAEVSNQIFSEIEDELSKRLANETEIEVSARTLVENRYLLGKINAGYAAQTKDLVVRGKNAIEYLTRNVRVLKEELAEVERTKTSYRHPLKKRSKEQKQAELTQKLNAAEKRLALAVANASIDSGKVEEIDAEYEAQTRELKEKRDSAIDFLTKNVRELEEEFAQIQQTKTSNFHFLKKVAQEERQLEITRKLIEARRSLALAEQNSGTELQKIYEAYEKKKKATIGKMQNLEKSIAIQEVDSSAEVRKQACNSLSEAVTALVQRMNSSPDTLLSADEKNAEAVP